jgi:hypothetical protein
LGTDCAEGWNGSAIRSIERAMTKGVTKPDPSDPTRKEDRTNARWIAAGAAMGIGSAALVAALLYTNRNKGEAKPAPKPVGPPPESD